MLKSIRIEILIIGILFLSILVSQNLNVSSYNYFSYINIFLQKNYLIIFFEKINTLGDSFWYFLISLITLIFCYIIKKINIFKKYTDSINNILFINFLLILTVLTSGIITQALKHIIGRSRPYIYNLEGKFDLNFFTFDSGFHSFPSGHTSTIFSVALVASLLAPKIKYFFYFIAAAVSFSRIVLGEHFITDLIGGATVAFIGFKISKLILNRFYENNKVVINNTFKLVIIVFLLFSLLLTVGPTFDIFFSKLFQYQNNNFLLQSNYFKIDILNYSRGINPTILFRKIFLPVILLYIFILPILSKKTFIKKIYFEYVFKLYEIIFLWVSSLIGLIFIVNFGLKGLWGRARPNDVLDFGGTNNFTPWYQISDQCINNCSFVSGDSSVGFALIVFYFIIKRTAYLWIALIIGSFLGLIRIMEGEHFISDVVFSALIIFIFYQLCYSFYIKKYND